ncbi:NB-ARC domain-containing protein [Nostoc sp. HK-01]|nr:NB-ARC domain-containing protein [Nostoc sp. HK-01]
MARPSYGEEVEARVRTLLEKFLAYANDELEDSELYKIALNWETPQQVIVRTQLRVLAELSGLTKEQVREALKRLEDFLGILKDEREHEKGSENWHFRLMLWHDKSDKEGNLQKFDAEWQRRREELPGVQREKSKKTQPKPTRYENIPLSGVVEFVGREAKLQELHQLLQSNQQVAIAAIAGMGGVGKTELALQYANSHRVTYQGGICWLSAVQDVGLQLVQFAMNKLLLNIPDDLDLAARVQYCLTKWHEGEVLLVIDNVTNYRDEVRCYLESVPARFKQLITTREKLQPPIVRLDLDVLTPLAAMQLLKSIVGRERLRREPLVARRLCKWLGYLPLGLELVGRYLLGDEELSLAEMLQDKDIAPAIPHIAEVANNLIQFVSDDDLISPFLGNAWFYKGQGLYDKAEPWYKKCLEITKLRLGKSHHYVAVSLNNLGVLYNYQGRYSEAETFLIQALELSPKLLEEENPLVAISLNSLGLLYNYQGRDSEGEPFLIQALELSLKLLGEENPLVATSLNSLGVLYNCQGRDSEAEPLLIQALEIRRKVLGEEHPDFATSLNNLGGLYCSQGKYNEAEPLYIKALEINRKVLGEDHPFVATNLSILGKLYHSQGKYNEAEPLWSQALEIRRKVLGEEHPDFATSLHNLAFIYDSQGRYTEAEPLYVQALELTRKLLGESHPDVVLSLDNFARFYESQSKYSAAEALYIEALTLRRKMLGEENLDITTSLNNLVILYISQSRFNEAATLQIQALELIRKLLGDEHPDVGKSLSLLTSLYLAQGRYSETELLLIRELDILEQRLGVNHINTVTMRKVLADLRDRLNSQQ